MPLWGKSKKKKAAKAAAAAEAKAKIEALAAKLQEDMASVMRSITDLDGETVMESENYGIAVANAMSGMTDAVTSFLPPAAEDDEAVYDEADDDGLASFAALREESQTEDLDGAPGLAFPGADDDAADANPPPPPPPTAGDGALNTPPAPDVRAHSGSRQAARPVRRLLLVDKQVSPHGHLANAALDTVTVIDYDSADTTLEELLGLIRGAHRKHDMPFTSIACAQHGPDEEGLWIWTSDHVIDLGGGSPQSPITQLVPIVEALGMALEKTRMGKAHIDFLACGLAGFAPRLVIGLEKMYGIDFRASTDNTGNDVNGGDWKMETDNDYDVADDYLDRVKLVAYTEVMAKTAKQIVKDAKMKASKAVGKMGKGNTVGQGFSQLVNEGDHVALNADPADNEQPKDKAVRKAKKYGKKGVVIGAGVALGQLVPGIGAVVQIPALKCTETHLANLKKFLKWQNPKVASGVQCTCEVQSSDCTTSKAILEFVIVQKQGKLNNIKLSMAQLGVPNTIRRKAQAAYKIAKGTKGVERTKMATLLHLKCQNGCPLATAVATELLGGYTNGYARDALKELIPDKKKCIDIFEDKMSSA